MALNSVTGRLPRLVSVLAWAVVFVAAAWIAAGWFWAATAPAPFAPTAVAVADPAKAAAAVVDRRWFAGSAAASTEGAADTARYRLYGAMTGDGRTPGMAVIGESGKSPLAVIEGEELAPGIRLERVLPRAVELRRQGVLERLELQDASGSGGKS